MIQPKTILLAYALFLGYLPSQSYAQVQIPETVHAMNVSPASSGVCSLFSKFDGEAHKITITWTGPSTNNSNNLEVETEFADGLLWKKEDASPTSVIVRAITYASSDCSADFTVKKRAANAPGRGGKGSGAANDEAKGYANQIQIHAYAPSTGAPTPFSRIPRPDAKAPNKTYYGFLAPHIANQPTSLDLVFNSKNKGIGKNTITLTLPSGVETPEFQTGNTTFDGYAFGLKKTLAVRLKDGITTAQTIKLKLENESGDAKSEVEDSVALIPMEFMEVSFAGDKYWAVWSDKGHPSLGGKVYEAPHWIDANQDGKADNFLAGDHNYPVAYSRNSIAKIGAKIRINKHENMNLKLKATGPGNIVVPPTDLQQDSTQPDIWNLPETSSGKLPSTIKYYSAQEAGKEFKLSWHLSVDGGATWNKIRDTLHTVYVTLGDPLGANLTGPERRFQETLFNIGCRNADKMADNSNNLIVDAIYKEFTDQKVNRVIPTQGNREPEVLAYWKDYDDQLPMGSLLASNHRNGACGDWAMLLSHIIRNQGIAASSVSIKTNYSNSGVMVKNWQFIPPGISGNLTYPYIEGKDAVPLTGIPAQGHADGGIGKSFNLHIITLSGNYLYDPSYGSAAIPPLNNQPDYKKYEDSSFSGYKKFENSHCRMNNTDVQNASEVQSELLLED